MSKKFEESLNVLDRGRRPQERLTASGDNKELMRACEVSLELAKAIYPLVVGHT